MKRAYSSTIIFVLSAAMFGLILIILSQDMPAVNGINLETALSTLGTAIVVATVSGFIFENYSKNRIFEEISEKIIGSGSAFDAGIERVFKDSKHIRYDHSIARASKITTFFGYSDRFIKDHYKDICAAIDRGAEIRMIFLKKDSRAIEAMRALGWNQKSMESSYDTIDSFVKRIWSQRKSDRILC